MSANISLVLMALIYIGAGLNHFRDPGSYMQIMPPYLPWPYALVIVSGLAEVLLGVLVLVKRTRRLAAWGLIALLIAVFPANLYMFQQRNEQFREIPAWLLAVRLPLQALLIWWAYGFTKRRDAALTDS